MEGSSILRLAICCVVLQSVVSGNYIPEDLSGKETISTKNIKEYINKIVSELVQQHNDDLNELKYKIDSQEEKIEGLEKDRFVQKAIISELEHRIENLETSTVEHSSNDGERKKQNSSKKELRPRVRRATIESPIAFSASINQNQEHLGQGQDITFDHVITNVGSAYNNHHGTFVAPVSGIYVFYFSLHSPGARADLVVNGTAKANLYIGNDQASQSIIVTLKAGDDVSVQNIQSDKLYWGSGYSTFSGFLLYEGMDVAQIVG